MLIGVWSSFLEWRVLSCLDSVYKTKPRISWSIINVTLLNKYHNFVRPAFFEIFIKVEKYIDDRTSNYATKIANEIKIYI